SGGTQRSSPHQTSAALQSGADSAASRYAGAGLSPPVSTIAPPRLACSASNPPTAVAGSSLTWSSGRSSCTPPGYVTGVEGGEHVDAREPGPLAVGLEQLVRLLGLGTAAPQRGHELDEPQVAGEPALVAPEPVQADDADRPRAEPRLAEQPPCHRVGGLPPQALEVERAAEADERRGAARAQAE